MSSMRGQRPFPPHFWPTAVLLLAACFRLIWLANVPPGLAQDEILDADIAALIRQGQHAFFFREGYGHEPLYHYWAAPFAPLLGDNYLAIRLPSVILGLWLVAATFRWSKQQFGTPTAVGASFGLAISWWPIIFSRLGIRPISVPLFLLGMAWAWPKRPWLAGLCLGLSFYTYTPSQLFWAWPLLLTAVGLLATPATWRNQLKNSLISLATAGVVALPLYLTWLADPSLLQRVDQLAGPLHALRQGDVSPIFTAVGHTLGVFSFIGDPRSTYGLAGRPLFDLATSAFLYLGFLVAVRQWRQPRYALLLSWLAVGLLPSILTPQSPSTIRLIGAMPAIYLLLAIGVNQVQTAVANQTKRPWLAPIFTFFLLGLALFNGYRTAYDGFWRWPQATETRLSHYQTVFLDMATHWRADPAEPVIVVDPFFEPIDADSLRRNAAAPLTARWLEPAGMVYPAGQAHGRLYLPEYAPLTPSFAEWLAWPDTPLYRSPNTPSFAVYALPPLPQLPLRPTAVTFADSLSLQGYQLLPASDTHLYLVSQWQVERPLPPDLTIFLHLVDDQQQLLAQHDGFDAAPSTLQVGDIFLQWHTVQRPTAPRPWHWQIGLYTANNGERWLINERPANVFPLIELTIFDDPS